MAISLVPQNVSDYVKLVSVSDSAIDWEKSFVNAECKDDEESIEDAKKRALLETRDVTQLAFKPDDAPTYFIFKNPKSLENSKAISNIQLGIAGIGSGKKKLEAADLWFSTFDALCVGTASDLLSDPVYIPRDKHTKLIDRGVLQALAAQGVVSELAGVLLSLNNEKGNAKKN